MTAPIVAPSLKTSGITVTPGDFRQNVAESGSVFRSILADSIQQVQNSQDLAGKTIEQFLAGENQDLHQVAIASQKADLTFEFFLQARNKVVAAYQEIMRMQL